MGYLIIMFSIDIASFEHFSFVQVFGSSDSGFYSRRGLITGLGLFLSLSFGSIAFAGVVGSYSYVDCFLQ